MPTKKTKKETTKTTKTRKVKEPVEEIREEVLAEPETEAAEDPVEIEEPVEVEEERVKVEEEPVRSAAAADPNWHEGYPKRAGIYLCRVDGKERPLYHYISLSCKIHKWVEEDGIATAAAAVLWAE